MAICKFSASVAEITVRLYFSASAETIKSSGIIQALTETGINILPPDTEPNDHPCLFCIQSITPELYQEIQKTSKKVKTLVIFLPGAQFSSVDHWKLLQDGAADIVNWERSIQPAKKIAARLLRWQEVDILMQSAAVRKNLIGKSPTWLSVLQGIVEIAHFTTANLLLLGESGTGKELTARLIHDLDARKKKGRFVILDCTTIVSELAGSEFFGHECGAFTGASHTRDGAFALADQGTLFLDEVGELPLSLQAQLLRVVQEGSFKRIGGNTWKNTAFRLVCATNRNLEDAVKRGEFRHDLYHRIANWTFTLPPLRDRCEDILPLVRHFIHRYCQGYQDPELDSTVCNYLASREYTGNIRELKQLALRIMHRHVGPGLITAGDIPEGERPCV
ncbi:MAG: sigma-54-dependent Fis family transcriptional regulator, partial [Candidatus Electrothrix sp. AR3]|nr:sigma-54-dependent Fis family transcriptional regulator [Candidatus Electrothrix sp. AR3]